MAFAAGLVLLVGGAELLVRGASQLAASVGIPPLVVGLTVVAFGTSAPELAVSVSASAGGNPGVAMGNVVGSNIFNVLVILGLSALAAPLVVSMQLIRIEVPLMIGISLALLLLAADSSIGRGDGLALLLVGLIYTGWTIRQGRRASSSEATAESEVGRPRGRRSSLFAAAGGVVAGLVLLVIGSDLFVGGAIEAAESLGVSDLVIGLTLVAAGTSMPELATSLLAGLRGQRDLAVGNVIGSNLFNIMWVLGVSGLVASDGIEVSRAALRVDIPVMVAVAIAVLPIFFTGRLIARWEGLLFLAMYAGYVLYLFLDATERGSIGPVPLVTLGFVLPLVLLTLGYLALRGWRRERDEAGRGSRVVE
ncbi:MAG: calcium/sodium antiporter [Chloroflexi bacterium]|nr:calcium/sodium antiporter [Chloroflexota bacterium]MDA1148219.1 calcium/sodium antiporter [Chloroflexota bacterium]